MKKFLSLLLVLAMFTFALAGCGGGQPDGDVEQPAGDSQGEQP